MILFYVFCAEAAIPYPNAAGEPGTLHGWLQSGEYYWYYNENGEQVCDGFTPDGYYLDYDGRWRYETLELFQQKYKVVDRYTPSGDYGDFTKTMLSDLNRLDSSIRTYIGSARLIRMNDEAVTYNKRTLSKSTNAKTADSSNITEKLLIGLYKDEKTGGWRLRLAGYLGDKSGLSMQMSTYDYLVFRYFLSMISHVPGYVSDGIYDSWQGKNRFGINSKTPVRIGDVQVTVKIVNGAADYYITGCMQ